MLFDDVADSGIVDGGMDVALHHCAALVIFDVAFPALGGHAVVLAEALLAEVAQCEVVGVGHQILYFSALHLLFAYNTNYYLLACSLIVFRTLEFALLM